MGSSEPEERRREGGRADKFNYVFVSAVLTAARTTTTTTTSATASEVGDCAASVLLLQKVEEAIDPTSPFAPIRIPFDSFLHH